MKRAVIVSVLLCLMSWCYGQKGEEECISNYFELENTLLSNPANRYQIIEGYLPLKREISPVCVTSYYYVGMNSSDEIKQNCPTGIKAKDEILTGCSKWRWCTNSFYMGFDLGQLQDFSFHILLDATSEVELELPPACNITEDDLTQYLLRITMLVSWIYHTPYVATSFMLLMYICSFITMPGILVYLLRKQSSLDMQQSFVLVLI